MVDAEAAYSRRGRTCNMALRAANVLASAAVYRSSVDRYLSPAVSAAGDCPGSSLCAASVRYVHRRTWDSVLFMDSRILLNHTTLFIEICGTNASCYTPADIYSMYRNEIFVDAIGK